MDLVTWERLASERYLSQPLDWHIVKILSAALPPSCGNDARAAFETGARLLCASLNKGDTYLPLDQTEFLAAASGWLDMPENWQGGVPFRKDHGDRPAETVDAFSVKEFLRERIARFSDYLDRDAFGAVVSSPEDPGCPIIYDSGKKRLYFERYFQAVRGINDALANRLGDFPFAATDGAALVKNLLANTPAAMRPDARQAAALLLALRNKTLLVSGGPGTGKTFVVLQIVRLFMAALPWLSAEDIRLAAPTGRAAARLQESIAAGLATILGTQQNVGDGAVRGRDEALAALRGTTVHRLLGYIPSSASFARGPENPIDAAVVVVDEVSMLDIELFGRLLSALPEACVLILLGDRFQLPPVEAGAVLGDLTARFDRKKGDSLSERTVKEVAKVLSAEECGDLPDACGTDESALRDRAVILTRSHRSGRAVQDLARAINSNEHPMAALGRPLAMAQHTWGEVLSAVPAEGRRVWLECGPDEKVFPKLEGWLMHHFGAEYQTLVRREVLDAEERPGERAPLLLDALETSRILTVVREGDRGAAGINEKCCKKLFRIFDKKGTPEFFHGMPLIVTRNAPDLELYNGDCGVLLRGRGNGFFGLFRTGGKCVAHPAGALPRWEPCFAMTVHKSQGSEYRRVLLVLPAAENPLCTREILYTAITRAKEFAAVIGERRVVEHGLGRAVSRNTGIKV